LLNSIQRALRSLDAHQNGPLGTVRVRDHRAVESAAERRRRKASWFDRGVHALGRVLIPRPPEIYACPLCLGAFTTDYLENGQLTDEHVPPKSVGGNPIVLTCRYCNRLSGSYFDEAVATDEKLRTFGQPHALGSLPATVTRLGVRNNGSIRFDGQTFFMVGDPGQNNPQATEAITASLERVGEGSTLQLAVRVKHDPLRAGLGWLRAAYLAAFAMYGYAYVLQPAFNSLRAAIGNPDSGFDPVILRVDDEGAMDPLFVAVSAPELAAGCRAVLFGPRLVLLPPWAAPEDWFDTLRERLASQMSTTLSYQQVMERRFPTEPMHLNDG
jgi:hypothetical protein